MVLILAGLAFWVILLFLLTSPLWIPLSICWAPAAASTYLLFRYTQVSSLGTIESKAGEKAMAGAERVFYSVLYSTGRLGWVKKALWKNVYNLFSL